MDDRTRLKVTVSPEGRQSVSAVELVRLLRADGVFDRLREMSERDREKTDTAAAKVVR